MNGSCLNDFYHGWLIELIETKAGFSSVCSSSTREKLVDAIFYTTEREAICAAKEAINWWMTCRALSNMMRELYEGEHLSFEDWQALHQSLKNAESFNS